MTVRLFPSGTPISKRLFDLIATSLLLVLLSPVLCLVAGLVYLQVGRPLLFRQRRPGFQGNLFTLFKFRTMTEQRGLQGEPLPDQARITTAGRFLRAMSLDELPELFNVLRGEMSLVGPRPLLIQYLDRYSPEQARRHEVTPGITGWAQVNGRNDLSWEDKFRLDVWYVDHWSFGLDLKILGMTAWKVLTREGISQEGYVSSAEFMGTPPENNAEELENHHRHS